MFNLITNCFGNSYGWEDPISTFGLFSMFGVFLAILFIAIRFYTKLENSKEIKILEFVYFPIYRTTDVLQLNRKAVLGSEDLPNIPLKNPQSKALSYFVYFLIFAISLSLLFGDFTLVKIY